jgi:hypothetical protein
MRPTPLGTQHSSELLVTVLGAAHLQAETHGLPNLALVGQHQGTG